MVDQQKSSMYIEKTVNEAAQLFDINSNALGYFVSDNDADASLCSVISKGKSKQAALLPAELFESYGTIRFINIFHNDDINKNHAQIIFNTHNSIFLNSNLFRRDEIKFVERSDETGESEIYALSDFGTAAENSVRKSEDYMRNYFVSKYGAIRNIDFTPLFEGFIQNGEGV